VGVIPAVYNATRRAGTYTDEAIIIGYHSPETVEQRLARMRADMERLEQGSKAKADVLDKIPTDSAS